MDHLVSFTYRGKAYFALVLISLQNDLQVIFASLKDEELIKVFGCEIDFQINNNEVIQTHIFNANLLALQQAVLEAVKKLPEFKHQQSLLQGSTVNA